MPDLPRSLLVPLVALALMAGATRASPRCRGRHWLGVWAASPSDAANGGFVDQSLRLIVTPTFGGRRVRVRLSNRFGRQPVTFDASWIARRASGATLVPHSSRRLRFSGHRAVTIPAGAEVASDPVTFRFGPFQDLAISVHVQGASGPATEHALARQTSYASPPESGDHSAERGGSAFTVESTTRAYITDVEVKAPRRVGAVVALGDSITDGTGPSDVNQRYTDFLARRLAAAGGGRPRLSVLNAGIGGTGLLNDAPFFGPSALHRLDADVIGQAGASVAIVLDGTNDLSGPSNVDEVIAALRTIVDRLHDAGLSVLLGTQTPAAGAISAHGTPAAIAARNRVNDWIREGGSADGVVDFDAAVRDPSDFDRLRPEYDSGNHLHPNAAGYRAMADAVDLGLLRGPMCSRSGRD